LCLNQLVGGRRPVGSMLLMIASLIVIWFLYVPVHELLHALGCVTTGGTISRLEISPRYGGALLARWFSFVVPGGEYAGRLSGFDTHGSDLVYLATDVTPFVLSIFLGVPLLRACTTRRRPILLGAGVVVGLAPFYSLPGDYYEMGSIIVTRAVTVVGSGSGAIAFAGIRSDDVFKLIGDMFMRPGELGLAGPLHLTGAALLIAVSLAVGLMLAIITYALGDGASRLLIRQRPVPEDKRLNAPPPGC